MNRILKTASLLGVLALGLAACGGGGGGGGGGTTMTVTPPASASAADAQGPGFAAAFKTDPNGDARDPAPGDVIAVNPSADPVKLR